MKKQSAGLLVYRTKKGQLEVLIAHMGAPWWAKKDAGAWSVPKGEFAQGEDPKETAEREFREELGMEPPVGEWLELGEVKQKNNKTVIAWAVEGDLNADHISSNTFKAEWPPRSGKVQEFPEIDRAGWFSLAEAAKKLIPAQVEFLERLADKLGQELEPDEAEPETSQQTLL